MAVEVFRIIDAADQRFSAVLNGRRCTMRIRYNPTVDRWSFDLSIDDKPALYARRLVAGVDLLEPFDLGLGLLVVTSGRRPEIIEPGRQELVNGLVKLYHFVEEDLRV